MHSLLLSSTLPPEYRRVIGMVKSAETVWRRENSRENPHFAVERVSNLGPCEKKTETALFHKRIQASGRERHSRWRMEIRCEKGLG